MSKRFKDNNEPSSESSSSNSGNSRSSGVLTKLNVQDLKNIKVAIRRPYLPETPTPGVIQRSLENPADLCIHRTGCNSLPKIALIRYSSVGHPLQFDAFDSRRKAVTHIFKGEGQHPIFARDDIVVNVEEHLEERIVSKSPINEMKEGGNSRTKSSTGTDKERSQDNSRHSYSRSPSKDSKKGTPPKDSGKYYPSPKKGFSPNYKYEKYNKDKSPKPGTSKDDHDRERNSRSRGTYFGESPKRYDKRSSRTPSPHKSGYSKSSLRDRYTRGRTPPPYSKRHSRSPRRSRSPFSRKSSYVKRRSPSPYSRKSSRSSRSPHKPRNRSRSPGHSGTYPRRSRSPPHKPHKHFESKEKYHKQTESEEGEYGMHPDFGYYGAEGYWVPRPEFIPRGSMPPAMGFPRGPFRPPFIIHRPYMPLHYPFQQFRPRFPPGYVRPFRPRITLPQTTSVSSTTANENTCVETTTVVTEVSNLQEESSDAIVEESTASTENADSNVSA